jgi:hypothetical protein
VVAELYLGDPGTDGGDHSGNLMAEHARKPKSETVFGDREIGVTKPSRFDVDEYLASDRFSDVDVLDHESFADGIDDRCPHGSHFLV